MKVLPVETKGEFELHDGATLYRHTCSWRTLNQRNSICERMMKSFGLRRVQRRFLHNSLRAPRTYAALIAAKVLVAGHTDNIWNVIKTCLIFSLVIAAEFQPKW